MTVAKADIIARAPELASLSDSAFTTAIADAALQLAPDFWGDILDLATVYLCAHMLAVQNPSVVSGGAGPVSSESVGPISRSYAVKAVDDAEEYATTRWGLEYVRLRKQRFRTVVA